MRRFPDDAAPDYWYWLLDNARELGLEEHLRPAPPSHLMGRVVGEESYRTYFKRGLVDWRSIEDSLRRAGFDPRTGGRILDFGAGCGQTLRQGLADALRRPGDEGTSARQVEQFQTHCPISHSRPHA